jgi:hypothetical protein
MVNEGLCGVIGTGVPKKVPGQLRKQDHKFQCFLELWW